MAGRRTNLGLLTLTLVAGLTGAAAFATGTEAVAWIAFAHGAAGLGLLVLVPRKVPVVQHGLERRNVGRWWSVVLAVVLSTTVVTGIAHAMGLRDLGAVTSMQVHVGAALLALPVLTWHVLARPARPRRVDLSRRAMLRSTAVAAAGAGVWIGLEGVMRLLGLPGADRRSTGSYEALPSRMPVTQWLDDRVQYVDPDTWRLTIRDADGERELTLGELGTGLVTVDALLDCTGGWWANQPWQGLRLDSLVRVRADQRSVLVTSVTGYRRRYPVRDLNRLLLATGMAGAPLTPGHGAPARIVAPGRRGFWWVKWVDRIETSPLPWWLQLPFPPT